MKFGGVLMGKILDGCGASGCFWVLLGGFGGFWVVEVVEVVLGGGVGVVIQSHSSTSQSQYFDF